MGLDIVEIVVDIEKEFGVEIPNSEAPHLLRLEDMKKFIVHEIRKRGDKTLAIDIWRRLQAIVVERGFRAEEVTPETHLVDDLGLD